MDKLKTLQKKMKLFKTNLGVKGQTKPGDLMMAASHQAKLKSKSK